MKLSVLFCGSWAYCHKNAERVSFRQNTRLFLFFATSPSGADRPQAKSVQRLRFIQRKLAYWRNRRYVDSMSMFIRVIF